MSTRQAIIFMAALFGMCAAGFAEEKIPPAPAPQKTEESPKAVEKPAPVAAESPAAPVAAQEAVSPPAPPAPAAQPPVIKEEPKAQKEEAARPFGCVAHLTDLVKFHEKEIASLKSLIERWNDKVGSTIKRRQDREAQILDIGKQIDELQKSDDKSSKKEIARLTKQSARIDKDIKALDKEAKAQCRELAREIKEVSKEACAALKIKYQEVLQDVLGSLN